MCYDRGVELFHLIGRGVDKRTIVLDDDDRIRFVHDLYTFNDSKPAAHSESKLRQEAKEKRKQLVDIHAWALMNNHYHMLVSERAEGGISQFMKKMNMGYAKYFNKRYVRSGALWQGKYRKVHIQRDAHFLYIPFYIHLNPLDYTHPEWREGRVQSTEKATRALEQYRWSSYLDYVGIANFKSIITTSLLGDLLGSKKQQEKTIAEIIHDPLLASESNSIEIHK